MTTLYPPWTAEQDAMLRAQWPAGVPDRVIAERLGRTAVAVQIRATKLGLRRPRPNAWTDEQEQVLRNLWPKRIAMSTILERVGHSYRACTVRASRLDLRRPDCSLSFDAREDERIRRVLATGGDDRDLCAALPGRSVTAVRARARILGLPLLPASRLARKYKLPVDLRLREIQLVLLLSSGPKTITELTAAMGTNPRYPMKNRCGRSYLTGLIRRGLVARQSLGKTARLFLTAHALDLLVAAAPHAEVVADAAGAS